MIEVFKTDVKDKVFASILVEQIHKTYTGYSANFDLDDCDNILRVKSISGIVQADPLILLLKKYGFSAEVLPG
ncbi:MAG: hypothetical protein J0I32_12340 [Sphingobacteriales bacterium]|nr:hypothetical protein [Sphingobacteriales bacterium]OJW00943.1 MAG: hypothetical protein BGO52_05735 [Sphingobacteriales bacterium 44-61]